MIHFQNAYKTYPLQKGYRVVLNHINLKLPDTKNIGVVGRNGAGKSTLVRLIAGIEALDQGSISCTRYISWPLGFAGGFNGHLSGEDNSRLIAKIYGQNQGAVIEYAKDFAELGPYFHMPVRTYSSGMRARLAFGLSMAIAFEVYLIDEVIAVGDKNFSKKCRTIFEERKKSAKVFLVSHNLDTLKKSCDVFLLLDQGELRLFDCIQKAQEAYERVE